MNPDLTGIDRYNEAVRFPIVTIPSTGLRVGNFSSFHEFSFNDEDRTVLEGCPSEVTREAMLETEERIVDSTYAYDEIEILFHLSAPVKARIERWLDIHRDGDVDIVLTPLPVMECIKSSWDWKKIKASPFRTVRVANRVNKLVHHKKFCI